MKRLVILLAVMSVAVFLMLQENDQKEIKNQGKKLKNKFKKTHFPKNEPETA